MSKFRMKVKYYDDKIADVKGSKLSDFDDLLSSLKEKFSENKKKRRR